MMKFIFASVAILLSACGTATPSHFSQAPSSDPLMGLPSECQGPCVVAFGDSLTKPSFTQDMPDIQYASYFADLVSLPLLNLGYAGSRISEPQQIGRIRQFKFKSTDVVVFLTGTNDMRATGMDVASLRSYEAYLDEVAQKILASGAILIIGTCPKEIAAAYSEGSYNSGSDAAADFYSDAAKRVAAHYGIRIADINAITPLAADHYIDSGIHFNAAGAQVVADTFFHAL